MVEQAKKVAETLKKHDVVYLFIGKFGAMLYGYPGTTQDIDLFPKKERSNCEKLVQALKDLGFDMDENLQEAIVTGKDFIQIRGGPIPLDIVFSPDGIESFDDAMKRGTVVDDIFYCASIDDIIQSKRAAGRQRDKEELPRLELFRDVLRKK
ncbi:MAG: hypothetical protein HY707_04255 [Ignavibacteriae bacterium]|nr:hypothetical protein [Ignavibacteriota bacterium]